MSVVTVLFFGILSIALLSAHSHYANRRLRKRGHEGLSYRAGYFLGLSMYLFFAVLFVSVMNALAAGDAPIVHAVAMIIAFFAARGIGQRRRYGWVCLFGVAAVYVSPYFLAGILVMAIPGWVIAAAVAALMAAIIVYARKRWPELRPGWPISGPGFVSSKRRSETSRHGSTNGDFRPIQPDGAGSPVGDDQSDIDPGMAQISKM